jgi:ABC-type lipoprotein export system ATPase subunit
MVVTDGTVARLETQRGSMSRLRPTVTARREDQVQTEDASPLIRLSDVTRRFAPEPELAAVQSVSLDVARGEVVAIVGRSGSGKSTLLQLMGALDEPDAGVVEIGGTDVAKLSEPRRTTLRREHLGFVFQDSHLVPSLTVIENVALTAIVAGHPSRRWWARAEALLDRLQLAGRARTRPSTLSGGERQRVALARALFGCPDVLLADEPTGSLDARTSADVHDLLRSAVGPDQAGCVVLVTHDLETACIADRIVILRDGRLIAQRRFSPPAPADVAEGRVHEERVRHWLAEHR